MARLRESDVVAAFVATIQRQLAPFTSSPLGWRRRHARAPCELVFREGAAKLGPDLLLVVRHYFAVSGSTVNTVGYHYGLSNALGREILVYHWHQDTLPTEPHLHLGHGAAVGRPELQKAHVPTGPVGWVELLWLVREFTER